MPSKPFRCSIQENTMKRDIIISNKKVLLRERKRHTARRVVSTPSVVLPGYPPRGGRVPPPGGVPGQVPPRGSGYPPQGVPSQVPPRVRVPPGGGTQSGTPPCLMAFWEMLQSIMGYGYPPQVWTDKQSETITFPSYYVRGRYLISFHKDTGFLVGRGVHFWNLLISPRITIVWAGGLVLTKFVAEPKILNIFGGGGSCTFGICY